MGKRSLALDDREEHALRWCASVAPPAALLSHLSDHGILLRTEQVEGVPVPTRVATIAHDALRLAGKKASLQGRRVGVMHPDPGGADALAETLRIRGAQVAVLSLDPALLARAEALDPEVIVVDPRHFYGACWPASAAVLKHPQLRWACVLFSAPEVLEGSGLEAHDVPALCAQIQLLCAEYDAAVARARVPPLFEVALEAIGPARVLRVLVQSSESWRARFTTRSLVLEVDTSEGLIVGARGGHVGQSGDDLLGTAALNELLREHQGVVRAETVARPAVTNIMCPLDTALAGASHGRDLRESLRPRATQGLQVPSAVFTSARSMRPRTLIGVGNPTLRPRAEEPPPVPSARPALRASLPPVSWRDATLLQGLAPPPENDHRARASLPTSAATRDVPSPSAGVATPPDENDVRSTDALEPGQHEAAFLAMARAEAQSVRALDEVLHANRVSETSLAPPPPRKLRLGRPLAGALAAVLLTLGGLALLRAPKVTPLPWHTQEPRAATTSGPLPRPAAPDPSLVVPAAEPVPAAPSPPAVAAAAPLPEPVAAVVPPAEPVPGAQLTASAALAETDDAEEADEADDEGEDSTTELALEGTTSSSDAARRAKSLAHEGKLLLRKGRTSQAKEAFEGALALVPAHTRALSALAKLGLKEHDAEAALRYAGALAKVRPKSASALLILGDAQKLAGDTTSANATWERAAERGSRTARARLEE